LVVGFCPVKEAFTGQGLFVVGLFLGALALASVFACLACFVVQKHPIQTEFESLDVRPETSFQQGKDFSKTA
jgi:hypothetical protein